MVSVSVSGFPTVLLVVFGLISKNVPGNIGGSGLIVVVLARTQTVASAVGSVLFFGLLFLFLSGLWVQPLQIGAPLRDIMWYSPSGAAVRAILYSVFHAMPPVTTLLTFVCYTPIFTVTAVRYFRWE